MCAVHRRLQRKLVVLTHVCPGPIAPGNSSPGRTAPAEPHVQGGEGQRNENEERADGPVRTGRFAVGLCRALSGLT